MLLPVSNQYTTILKLRALCYVPAVAIITLTLYAQTSAEASDLPSNQQVIAFLTESIDWYRHCAIERQIATNPVDLVFLENTRSGAAQILQLSFDFARADAQSSATPHSDMQDERRVTAPPELAQFLQLQNDTELQSRQSSEEIEEIKNKINTVHGVQRRELKAALQTTQSRLEVLQAGSATLQQLVEFMQAFTSRQTGELASAIDDLSQTVPDVTTATSVASQTQALVPSLIAKSGDSGILALSSEVSALGRKLRALDDEIRRTDNLSQSSAGLRGPLLNAINRRLPAVAEKVVQGKNLTELEGQKTRLDELAGLVKSLSPAIVALDKQRVLLAAYTSHLKSWRAAVLAENKRIWKNLISRLAGTAVVIGALVVVGTIVRRMTRRHMHNTDRRHVLLVIQRVVLWSIILAIASFAFASDLTTLATFFGLLAAGIAVTLQSLILSAVGYFVLVGRRGIRIGDRITISGVTGEVKDIGWLQFQLKEIDLKTQQPTGNVVTFSNSFVLASPATGLSKFSRQNLKPGHLGLAARTSQQ